MSESDESSEPEEVETEVEEEAPETDGEAVTKEELQDRIDELEAERERLETRVAEAEAERDDLTARLKRKAADFENYKKRQQRQREQLEEAANERLVTRLLDVRDNLKRALDEEAEDVDSLREGVKLTLTEFDRVLDAEDVAEIDPTPGTAVDPERHEVMLQVDSEQPEGHIAEVYQSGYEMGEKVLRPAQVTVSDEDEEANSESEEESTSDR